MGAGAEAELGALARAPRLSYVEDLEILVRCPDHPADVVARAISVLPFGRAELGRRWPGGCEAGRARANPSIEQRKALPVEVPQRRADRHERERPPADELAQPSLHVEVAQQ